MGGPGAVEVAPLYGAGVVAPVFADKRGPGMAGTAAIPGPEGSLTAGPAHE
jgi:hypothetical protein